MGDWDFVSGVRLWELKNKTKIELVNPVSVPVRSRLREGKNAGFVLDLKQGL